MFGFREWIEKIVKEILAKQIELGQFDNRIDSKISKIENDVIRSAINTITDHGLSLSNHIDNSCSDINQKIVVIETLVDEERSNNLRQFESINELLNEIVNKITKINDTVVSLKNHTHESNNDNSEIKKTRADVATLIKKIKDDIADNKVELEAFIDTVSEKLAEIQKKIKKM